MTRTTTALTMAASILLLSSGEIFAHGGGGGGAGHGGGGAGHAGSYGSAGHSPALGGYGGHGDYGGHGYGSAADHDMARDGFPGYGPLGVGGVDGPLTGPVGGFGGHPNAGQLNSFLGGAHSDVGEMNHSGAAEFLHNNFDTGHAGAAAMGEHGLAGDHSAAAATAAANHGNFANHSPTRAQDADQLHNDRMNRANELRNDFDNNYRNMNFWGDRYGWGAWGLDNAWGWASWGALDGFLGYGWASPYAYDYGSNVYYNDNQVYYGDQAAASSDEYATQAQTIAASAPNTAPDQTQWMSLGVFAVTQDNASTGNNPSMFIQMVVSKQGELSGNISNQSTNEVQTLEGMIDKDSQRAAWTVKGQQWPVMETGVVNLTQDTTPTLVHFADGSTQQWLLVRMNDPNAAPAASTAPPAEAAAAN